MDKYNIARVQHFIIGGNRIQEIDFRLKPELPEGGFEWLHFDRAHKDARKWLERQSDINPLAVEALLEEDTRPRCAIFEEGILLNLRAIDFRQGAEIQDFISLRMWITPKRLVTFRKYYIPAIADAIREMENLHVPKTVFGLVNRLSRFLTNSSKAALKELESELETIRQNTTILYGTNTQNHITDLHSKAILLRQHLSPQRDAILKWSSTSKDTNTQIEATETCEAMSRLMERIETYLEHTSLLRQKGTVQLLQKINTNTGYLMKFAIVFLLLVIFAALKQYL